MVRAATKSATNVAPDNRVVDDSVLSGGARRRHPRPARPRPRPCRAAWTRRASPPGAAPACASGRAAAGRRRRSEEHTSELQSLAYLVCRLLLEKKKKQTVQIRHHM